MSLFLQLQVFITPRKGPFYGWHWHSEILTCGQTDSSSVVSSLQQYITTWHQLASSCWWNKHPPSHSLVGELPHAVKLFLHGFSPFSSSSWVSIYILQKTYRHLTSFIQKKKRKKSCALRRSHCDRKQLELTVHTTARRCSRSHSHKRQEKRERENKKQKNKSTKSDETVSNEPPDPHRLE